MNKKNIFDSPFLLRPWLKYSGQEREKLYDVVSHIFRTPLVSIKGYLDFLLQGYAGKVNKKHLTNLRFMHQGVLSLEKNIDIFLDVAAFGLGLTVPLFKNLDLGDYFLERESYISDLAKTHQVGVSMRLPFDSVVIRADKTWLEMLIIGLIANSIRIAPPKSSVRIELSKNKKTVVLQISIKGINIEDESLNKLFQQINSSKNSNATGDKEISEFYAIRLQQIVRLHHGQIWIKNTKQKREAKIFVALPAAGRERN